MAGIKKEVWYSGGLRFECTQCGDCCSGAEGYVWVNQEEINGMAARIGMTPADFERRYDADEGTAFSTEPLLTRSAYFRQPNRDRTVDGLYHVGAGAHPGAGVPGVLLGAEVAASLVRRDLGIAT
jgi:phytoene dehydrogenase-like protein